jgi:hypothetical protein
VEGTVEVTRQHMLHDGTQVTLNCREVDGVKIHAHLSAHGHQQYQFQASHKPNYRFRMAAPKAALGFCYPEKGSQSNMTASHLCHNAVCLNPYHVCLESLEVNKGRNGCAGPPNKCDHTPQCFIPGPNITSEDLSYIPTVQAFPTIFGAAPPLRK